METIYDRALQEAGADGFYQKKFDVIYNVALGALWCASYISLYLALAIPAYNCKLPDKPENVSKHEWKMKYIPVSSIDSNEDAKLSSCLMFKNPQENNETKVCVEFEYDKTWYETTIPSENDWVCDKELYVANVFTCNAVAELLGNIVAGWFGDRYGRRLTHITSLALIVVGRTISILAGQSYWIFVCGIFIASFPSWSIMQSSSVVSMEISSPERRTTSALFRFTALSFGVCLLSLLYWWQREWKRLFIITTLLLLPFLLMCWKYPESPRWLWTVGRTEESIKALKSIAKSNKRKLNPDTEHELLNSPMVNKEVLGALVLFSSWRLAFNTVLQLLIWGIVTISYTVLVFMAGQKTDGNPFLEVSWQSALEIPSSFVGAFLADRLGRRYAGVISSAVTGTMWTLVTFRELYTSSWLANPWAGLVIRSLCRAAGVTTFYLINLLNMELYPTCLRQSGMSLGNVFSSGSAAFAPYIIYLGRQVDSRLPGTILTILSVVGALSFVLLPETLNATLPETLEEAQKFGSKRKAYASVPTQDIETK